MRHVRVVRRTERRPAAFEDQQGRGASGVLVGLLSRLDASEVGLQARGREGLGDG